LKLCANPLAPQEINETNLFCVRICDSKRKRQSFVPARQVSRRSRARVNGSKRRDGTQCHKWFRCAHVKDTAPARPDEDFGGGMKLPEENQLWFLEMHPPASAASKSDRTLLLGHLMHRAVPFATLSNGHNTTLEKAADWPARFTKASNSQPASQIRLESPAQSNV